MDNKSEFRALLSASGWSSAEAARQLMLSTGVVAQYVSNKYTTQPSSTVLKFFKMLLAQQNPAAISATKAGAADTPKNHGGPYWGTSKRAPIISWASAGTGTAFEDQGNDVPHIATDCKDPNCYALRIEGDSMSPVYLEGDVAVVQPNSEAGNGSLVIAKTDEDDIFFKRVEFPNASKVRLVSFNPNYPAIELKRRDLIFLHPVFSVTRFMNEKAVKLK